jgi:hypothetical protein
MDPSQAQQIDPATGQPVQADQLQQVETKVTQPDGSVVTTKGPPGSMAEGQQTPEEQRAAQPSPVEGIPQGLYDRTVGTAKTAWDRVDPKFGKAAAISVERQLAKFGDWPGKNDPNAPPPPIQPFGPSFNPFTGEWIQPDKSGPSGMKMAGQDLDKYTEDYKRGKR